MSLFLKKNLGQNLLIDKKIIDLIVDIGNVKSTDSVIEVGPGTGALTIKILESEPKNFTVIEKDSRFVDILSQKFGNQIKIINKDMIDIAYENFGENNFIIFGNLPYNISTQILAKWIKMNKLNEFCKKFILMFQKEVADRIIAKVNTRNYGRLSILSNWKMKITKIIDIEPTSFNPPPKVKSSLLVFEPKKDFFKIENPDNLEHVTNIFFSQRRKMIKKPFKILFNNFEEISKNLSINLSLRPQNLSNIDYYEICKIYETSTN